VTGFGAFFPGAGLIDNGLCKRRAVSWAIHRHARRLLAGRVPGCISAPMVLSHRHPRSTISALLRDVPILNDDERWKIDVQMGRAALFRRK